MMKKYGILFIGTVLFALLFLQLSCRSSRSQSERIATKAEPVSMAEGSNIFTFQFLRQAYKSGDNLICSPFSIHTAMAMVYAGSAMNTADELRSVLSYPGQEPELYREVDELYSILNTGRDSSAILNMANGIWIQENFTIEPGYEKILNDDFHAPSSRLDFINKDKREEARKTINDWTAKKTGNRIMDMIPQGILNENTRLVLTNALYFKAPWLNTFNKSMTRQEPFFKTDGSRVQAPFMHASPDIRYYENDTVQMITLPYESQHYSMQVILPSEGKSLNEVLNSLDGMVLNRWYGSQQHRSVNLSLPRFTIHSTVGAKDLLMEMGLQEPFEETADLSGITGKKDLKVDDVLHKAFIEVNESGTEAAAATAVVIGLKAVYTGEPVTFRADRPFIFLIRENKSQLILFAGIVNDPTVEK